MARGYPPDVSKKKWKTVRFEDRDFYIITSTPKTLPEGTVVRTSFNPRTLMLWKKLLLEHPLESVLKMRRERWNDKQARLLGKWPPTVLWMDFFKVSNKVINASDTWTYVPKRKRARPPDEVDVNARNVRQRQSNGLTSGLN